MVSKGEEPNKELSWSALKEGDVVDAVVLGGGGRAGNGFGFCGKGSALPFESCLGRCLITGVILFEAVGLTAGTLGGVAVFFAFPRLGVPPGASLPLSTCVAACCFAFEGVEGVLEAVDEATDEEVFFAAGAGGSFGGSKGNKGLFKVFFLDPGAGVGVWGAEALTPLVDGV